VRLVTILLLLLRLLLIPSLPPRLPHPHRA
jgi:hypothetical protein